MKYRLKDQEFQKRLDELTNGDFTKKLESEARKKFVDILNQDVVQVYFGDFDIFANRFSVVFRLDEVEEIPEYDPNCWNPFPKVTPPEGVWMRVETDMGFGFKARFQFGDWLDNRNYIVGPPDGIDGTVVRFRPWDDDTNGGEA